jgi:hypothetical protein
VTRHIFQACPVWIYTQSNITQASYSPEYITPTQQISLDLCLLLYSISIVHGAAVIGENCSVHSANGVKYVECYLAKLK